MLVFLGPNDVQRLFCTGKNKILEQGLNLCNFFFLLNENETLKILTVGKKISADDTFSPNTLVVALKNQIGQILDYISVFFPFVCFFLNMPVRLSFLGTLVVFLSSVYLSISVSLDLYVHSQSSEGWLCCCCVRGGSQRKDLGSGSGALSHGTSHQSDL